MQSKNRWLREVTMNSTAAPGIDAGSRRRQLPAEVSAFVGRTDELAALAGLLRRARHVTVTGPGGVGKTRLALRGAADAANRYADGARVVELSGVADAALLPAAVAQCLGLRGRDPRPTRVAVLDHLRGQRLLLILDTCEHLTAAVARFASQVLRETDGITILTTSRQPLHLAGEQVLRLGPLPVPDAGRVPRPGGAVELFATRAAAALPGFTISDAELPDVIRICRRLDGVPLGVELAAVRVRALPLAELARRLDATFSVLAGARRGAVPRHQTLRTAIDWSYDLCTGAEQAVWQRLSVFAGSFDLAAARDLAACPLVHADQVGDVLAGLVDKSVVIRGDDPPFPPGPSPMKGEDIGPGVIRADTPSASRAPAPDHPRPVAGPADAARYRLIASVREYGADRLAAADQEADCRRQHARRYLRMARSFRRRLLADDQAVRLRELRAEHADLTAALELGFAADEPGRRRDAARLATALLPYWLMSGRLREGMRWQDAILARSAEPSAEASAGLSAEAASALADRAVLGAALGVPAAVADAREAIAMAARTGDNRAGGLGYLALQLALGLGGAYQESVEAAGQARLRLTAAGSDAALRCLDVQLGHVYQLAGNFTAAEAAGQRALAGLGPGERWLHGYVRITSALALYRQPGRRPECADAAADALRAMRDLGDPVGAAYALDVLGWLAADDGRFERSACLLGAAQARWELTGGGLGGDAGLAAHRARSAAAAARVLGAGRYAELHARGACPPIDQIIAFVMAGDDALPSVPAPRTAWDDHAGTPAGQGGAAGQADADELTSREREIASLVASGLSNREIADRLFISRRTVDAHVNHIYAKLRISSRVQLTIWERDRKPGSRSDEPSPPARG
jgi:predicted ATPase/DNA-binding CsgD family transcriptional regulator